MIPDTKTHLRLALLLLAGCSAMAGTAGQAQPSAAAAASNDDELARHLTTLASNPNSVAALTGAGKAALALGDPQAALTFLGRAEDLAPRDGWVKAGIGSALVMMEQPRSALGFFDQAVSLGVPDASVAGDRGLAYDLTGDPLRAQQDYQVALRQREDPEVRRRLALSLAISNQRDAALATIDDQLRRQDRAAWRARAFILALTGDAAGATKAVQDVMPSQAAAMAPFLARLPSLTPADRALAVNFGHFPGSGQPVALSTAPVAAPPASPPVTSAGTPDIRQTPLGTPARPSVAAPATAIVAQPQPVSAATVARGGPTPTAPAQARAAEAAPAAAGDTGAGQGALAAQSAQPSIAGVQPDAGGSAPASVAAATAPSPALTGLETAPLPGSALAADDAARPSASPRLADIAAMIAALPAASEQPGVRPATTGFAARGSAAATIKAKTAAGDTAAGSATAAARRGAAGKGAKSDIVLAQADGAKSAKGKTAKAGGDDAASGKANAKGKAAAAKAKQPARVWVQIGHASDAASLPAILRRVKTKAPKAFAGRDAWATSKGSTNRLLVGPFKSDKEAQAFIDTLAKADVAGISWTSPAGQEVDKLSPK
ncbi:MAG: SPOR domain-containing protein [Sphingomonadales bacterium]